MNVKKKKKKKKKKKIGSLKSVFFLKDKFVAVNIIKSDDLINIIQKYNLHN